MELTILADPATRTCSFREVRALCAGDSWSPVVVENVRGADPATLRMSLRRPDGRALAAASSFERVPGHVACFRTSMTLSTDALAGWWSELADESESDGPSDVEIERPARLEISDASRTWVLCDVPVLLRPVGEPEVRVIDMSSLETPLRLSTVDDLFAAVRSMATAAGIAVETEE